MKKIGIVIVGIGLLLSIVSAITFFTKEKVADIGGIEITRDKQHTLNWSPLIGIAVIGLGGILLLVSPKK